MHVAASSSHADVSQCSETLDDTSLRAGALGAASKRADALDSAALARRLGELAGDERDVQVDFLFHLDAFDRRRGFLDAGYASLWEFCQRALHLREGAAGRRISAMRVLRRFPVLEGALREGRLCLSTLALLGPVLTPENLEVVVGQAAFRTRAEVDRLVASLQPRAAPKDGLRRVAARPEGQRDSSSSLAVSLCSPAIPLSSLAVPLSPEVPLPAVLSPAVPLSSPAVRPLFSTPAAREVAAEGGQEARAPSRPEIRPVSADSYSLRVTVDTAFKDDLETL